MLLCIIDKCVDKLYNNFIELSIYRLEYLMHLVKRIHTEKRHPWYIQRFYNFGCNCRFPRGTTSTNTYRKYIFLNYLIYIKSKDLIYIIHPIGK